MNKTIDLDPLKNFFENDISPLRLSELLDNLSYDYTRMLLRMQTMGDNDIITINAEEYVFF